MDKNTVKDGVITLDEAADARSEAVRFLAKIKAARKGKVYRMIKVGVQTWKEIEVTNIKNITS